MSRYLDLAANCLALGERHPRRALALALAAAELLDRATRLGRPISPAEQERLAEDAQCLYEKLHKILREQGK